MQRLLTHFCQFLTNTQLTSNIIEWRYRQPNHLQSQPDQTKPLSVTTANGRQSFSGATLKVSSDTAQNNAQLWFELSCLQLDNQHLPEGIEGLSLIVEHLQRRTVAPDDLFHVGANPASRHELVDRLRSRLGLQAVGHLDYRYEHLPEASVIETHTLSAQKIVAITLAATAILVITGTSTYPSNCRAALLEWAAECHSRAGTH
ncbi:MAG: hypothetical protein CM15mP74_34590 [Halieaceae bacterium]|nr:MAG: hypothetical protein CM15mP74_34590 [Halieaceae bacterium]